MTAHFAQHKPETQHLGYPCPIENMPHYKALCGQWDEYIKYLHTSWGTDVGITKQVSKYKALLEEIKANGQHAPILLSKDFSGRDIIIDGNHRASVAKFLGINPVVQYVATEDYLDSIIRMPERYGFDNGKPYQSLYHNDIEIITGRRYDLFHRAEMIGRLDNQSVIDFGCNYASACHLAIDFGAAFCAGIEFSYPLALTACRINSLYCDPIAIYNLDLSKPIASPRFDVGFCFSIDLHVANNAVLADNIMRTVSDRLYFETHTGASIPAEVRNVFASCEKLGDLQDGRVLYVLRRG
jgi:hypothetical protein